MDVVTLALAKNYSKSYTDSAVAGISGGITYKGAVDYYSDLPNNPTEGDAYTVKYSGSSGSTPDGTEYVWGNYSGTNQWIAFGGAGSTVIANQNLSGNEPELTSLTIDGVKYKVASENTIYTNLLTMQYGTPANNGG